MKKTRQTLNNTSEDYQDWEGVSRRVFMKKMTAAFGVVTAGAVLGGSAITKALAYNIKKQSELSPGKIFSQPQMMTLKFIGDAILPRTETPSASEVDCHGFVDDQLFHCYSQNSQKQYIEIVDKISKAGRHENFIKLAFTEQQQILREIEQQIGFSETDRYQFSQLKYLLVFGFFTSEVGSTKALIYQPVPGGFKGSIKIDETTKDWGAHAYY